MQWNDIYSSKCINRYMDLLESLKNIYEDMDEEDRILREIENSLDQPTDVEEPEEPEVPVEDPNKPIQDPNDKQIKSPIKAPDKAPILPPVAKKVASTQSVSTNDPVFPAISTKMALPPPIKEPPASIPVPNQATVPLPSADIDPGDTVSSEFQSKLMKKLLRLRKEKKAYSMRIKGSEALSKLIYSPNSKTLTVKFLKNGRTYRYRNVGISKASAMIMSNHKGTLLNRSIKGKKPYKEL